MAMQLEEAGMVFYETAARCCADARVADLCRQLSADEQDHLQTFGRMRSAPQQRPHRPLEPEEMRILQECLDDLVLPSPEEARRLAEAGTPADVLRTALRMEKDSVALYRRLAPCVNDAAALRTILEEEEAHVRDLGRMSREGLD